MASIASRVYDDILHSIFPFLKFREFARVSGVSRHWNKSVGKNKPRNETIQGFDIDYVDRPSTVTIANLNTSLMKIRHVQQMSNMTRHVSTLDLTRCQLNNCDCKLLYTFNNVTCLDVSFTGLLPNQISWTDLSKSMSKLTSLNASTNNLGKHRLAVTSDGTEMMNLAHVIQETKCVLTYLNLSNNRISKEGLIYLVNALKNNKSITTLDLSENFIGGYNITEICKGLECNQYVTHLNLANTQICDDGIASIINASKTLRYLDISQSGVMDDKADGGCYLIIKAIKDSNLTSLYMDANYLDDELASLFADAIVHNQSLTCLDIDDNELTDMGIVHIVDAVLHSTTLTEFNISNSECGAKGLESICNLIKYSTRLTILHMEDAFDHGYGSNCTPQLAEAIKCSKSLTWIDLANNYIKGADVISLALAISMCPTLTYVGLENNNSIEGQEHCFMQIITNTRSCRTIVGEDAVESCILSHPNDPMVTIRILVDDPT